MNSISLRNELAELISKEKDDSLLEVIRGILSSDSQSALLRAKLTSRALKAEEDLAAGRTLTTDQVRLRLSTRKKQ